MHKLFPLALLSVSMMTHAQEGGTPTQVLVTVDSKDAQTLTANQITLDINGRKQPPTSLNVVAPAGAQIALLIDDGLRESIGRELNTLKAYVSGLPAGTEVFIGYMSNGRVEQASPFTTEHASAAAALRLPFGAPGISASPYFCVSDFVKRWPREGSSDGSGAKARFVMMITNGVDPYNGSTSPLNQDSPYVQAAITDAQRAGVAVYSIYFADAGIRGGRASFSGQSYLQQVAEGTGGRAYYEGIGNPVSLAPYLQQFQHDISETYVAAFPASGKDLVQVKAKTNVPHLKVRIPQQVKVGNAESGSSL